ncbi:hypothetical protein JMJ77_0002526 [Colletotrichum scovillei]|uniref:Uncharacterized protein n=1 Tax=Colletotrichum scovillei TaxID=1209932 RepID=A0A9P7R851_9PEZI|nr:hypothetical protein JMJ77_0002526 [Colletotrichum scovillei]KAG7070947.1 hypothetical protein JMJ76_0002189 [Colletotrichum scovillei]KAG7079196.1 hypothetical protein JMJ78_0002854 [Colletotrichum scovillei]
MENHIRSFMRVIRKIDDADELIQSFLASEEFILSQNDASPSLALHDQKRLLDFPDAETQAANIAESTKLSKDGLLERAVESPSQLTAAEISLLKNRYWMDISPGEEREVSRAAGLIMGPNRVSEEECEQAQKRLGAVRHMLYAENEEKAIDNAITEHWRRENEAWKARQRQKTENALSKAHSWVRRLWEEDKGEKVWGYGMFIDPKAFANDEEAEKYMARRDGVLLHARDAVGAGSSAINNKWKLQKLEWPGSDAAGDGKEMGARQAGGRGDAEEGISELAVDEDQGGGGEDEERIASFRILRTRFKLIRDRGLRSQKQEGIVSSAPVHSETSGLEGGILHNVFLMVDMPSVKSVLGAQGLVDDMWVWAVDPDYNDAVETFTTIDEPRQSETPGRYRGFMRVRLQQLVNNFFDARRFHERKYSMKELWEAAQKSKHKAFVSVRDTDARSWSIDRFVGGAMRAQPPRIVYGPMPGSSAETLVHK